VRRHSLRHQRKITDSHGKKQKGLSGVSNKKNFQCSRAARSPPGRREEDAEEEEEQ